MDLFATLILIRIMTLIGIGLGVWQRERLRSDPMLEDLMTEIPLPRSESSSAVLVATLPLTPRRLLQGHRCPRRAGPMMS